jgi:hypothetical protein
VADTIFVAAGKVVRMLKFSGFHPLSAMAMMAFSLFSKLFGNAMFTKGMISIGSNFGISLFSIYLCFAFARSFLQVPFKELVSATYQMWVA